MEVGSKRRNQDKGVKDTPLVKQLRLNNLSNARKTFTVLIRDYYKGKISTELFRNIVYSFNTLCMLFKVEYEMSENERIAAIEKALIEKGILDERS